MTRLTNGADTVGWGRYALAFLMAGFIGLGIQYLTRKQGWRGFFINLAIFVVFVLIGLLFYTRTSS